MSSEEKNKKTPESENASDFFSADPMARYKKEEKKSASGIKKNVILIICGVAIVAALAAGVAGIAVTGLGKDSTNTTESETADPNAITLFDGESSDNVKTVELTNSKGTFEIYRSKDAKGDDSAEFALKGYEDYKQDSSIVGTIANNPVGMSTNQTVAENVSDLSKYGLGDDAIKVTVTMDNGESKSFRVGSKTADSSYNYFCLEGENTVYTVDVSKVNNFAYGTDEFISKKIEDALDEDGSLHVESIDIKRSDINYDIVLQYDDSLAEENDSSSSQSSTSSTSKKVNLVMKEPVECNLNSEKASDTTNCIFGLSASEIVKLGPSDEDFKKCGLDNPESEVTIKTSDSKTYVLKIGNEYLKGSDDSTNSTESTSSIKYKYIYVEGAENIIYGISEEKLKWVYVQPIDISSKILMNSYVWDIGSLKVEAPGKETMEFVGTGSSKDDYKVTKNGKECDTERYRQFYAFLIKAYGEEFAFDEQPKGDPMLTVTYKEQKSEKGKTISFYDAGNTKSLIVIDGKPAFKCRKSFVEAVLSNIDIFDTDKDFATTWE